MEAEAEGEWVFTGEDGKDKGPYTLAELRRLLSKCGLSIPRSTSTAQNLQYASDMHVEHSGWRRHFSDLKTHMRRTLGAGAS